jgi:uncharacterized protein YuzE
MEFQLDRDVNALYIKLGTGMVSRTIELTDSIYVDMDAADAPIGLEFTNADELSRSCGVMPTSLTSHPRCASSSG